VELEFDAVAGDDNKNITVARDNLFAIGGRLNETVAGLIRRAIAQPCGLCGDVCGGIAVGIYSADCKERI
jgi:hypothetical protein